MFCISVVKRTYLTTSWIQSQMEASKLGLFKARGIKRAGLHKSSLQLTCKQRKGLRQWLDVKSRLCDWPRLAAVEWTFRRLCSIDLLFYVSIWHSEANGDNFSLFILGFESRETVCHCPRNKVEVEEAHFLLLFFWFVAKTWNYMIPTVRSWSFIHVFFIWEDT